MGRRRSPEAPVDAGDSHNFQLKPLAAAVALAVATSPAAAAEPVIEEIIVTASKREADMQDLPQSITAFTTEDIERMNLSDMESTIRALPSVTLVNSQPGRNSLVFRGISTGSSEYRTDSQVAVYLDEQPLTTNSQQVDPFLVDIERIEALPGPQGTLFGSSSQSGTLRIITNKPDFEETSSQIDASVGSTSGGDPSYEASGWLNIPLVDDRLGVRVAGFYKQDGGYIDNVLGTDLAGLNDNSAVVEDDYNEFEQFGGRITALWQISENWDATLGAIGQWSDADGAWESDPAVGDFKIVRFFDEYRDDDWYQVSFTLTGDLGFAELTATTSYFDRDIAYEWDNMIYEQYKDSYWGIYNGYALYNSEYTFGTIFNDQQQDRFSQEIRLTSTSESRFQWMVGGFYEDVHDEWFYGAQNPALMTTQAWSAANVYAYYNAAYYDSIQYPLAPSDIGYSNTFDRTVKQLAFFGEASFDITDAWNVTAGARWFEYDRDEVDNFQFPQGLPPFGAFDSGGTYGADGVESDTVYKFSTSYRLTDDKMVYFLYSEGFRLGGSNSQRAAATGLVPQEYDADKLSNYEVGLKSEWFDNRFQLNVTAFFMEWDDIQINNEGGVDAQWWLRGTINGDKGETKGAEIGWSWLVTENLSFVGNVFFADPEYKTEFTLLDGTQITDGTPIPLSPELKYYVAVDYTVPQFLGIGDLWIRYDLSYQDEVYNGIDSAAAEDPNGQQEDWTLSNLQVGMEFENQFAARIYVNNLFDEEAMNYLDHGGNFQPDWFGANRYRNIRSYARPRTIGVSFTKRF